MSFPTVGSTSPFVVVQRFQTVEKQAFKPPEASAPPVNVGPGPALDYFELEAPRSTPQIRERAGGQTDGGDPTPDLEDPRPEFQQVGAATEWATDLVDQQLRNDDNGDNEGDTDSGDPTINADDGLSAIVAGQAASVGIRG